MFPLTEGLVTESLLILERLFTIKLNSSIVPVDELWFGWVGLGLMRDGLAGSSIVLFFNPTVVCLCFF